MCESLIGKTIDNFRLLDVLGRGGMGCVYKSVDERMDRIVALKLIRKKLGAFSDREGKALGQLNHPNIVHVFYMGESEDGVFIAMEYIQGKTLNHFKMMPIAQTLSYLKQSLLALEHAHQAGVTHRDIKPSNIMVNEHDAVKVMDFGLAKVDTGDKNRTMTRFQAGTINYMSPEQIRGLHHVDHRSDLYSLGKTFYEMLAGRLPFDTNDSDQFDIWKQIVEVKFKPPSHFNKDIPKGVDKIIMKALEKKVGDRYQDARSMYNDIVAYERKASRPAVQKSEKTPSISKKSRQKVVIPLALLLGTILLTAGLYFSGVFSSSPAIPINASVIVSSDPTAATILIDEVSRGITPSDTLRFDGEQVDIRLSHADYEPLDTTITLQPGNLHRVHLSMLRSTESPQIAGTFFSIDSVPTGATVLLDGNLIGTTPLAGTPSAPGTHRLEVTLDGYESYAEGIEFDTGANPMPTVTLREMGQLDIDANRPNAQVSINGRRAGRTPLRISRTAGQYRVSVSVAGFSTFSQTVRVDPGETVAVSAVLEAMMATVRVLVNPFGAIHLDGNQVRSEEAGWYETSLPMGTHTLRATHSGFGEWEKEIVLDQNRHEYRINFLQEKRVNITSGRINGASIFIDGQLVENLETPTEVNIRIGRRRIEVRRDGYTTVPPFYDVFIEGNEPEPLRYTFELKN